jgi:hypothetical protein
MFTFVETPLFYKLIGDYLNDDEYAQLQIFLAANPEAGDVVKGSGGVRKVRWSRPGSGKRGGVRVIYFVRSRRAEIWLLTIYAKSAKDNIPGHVLRKLKEELIDEAE